MLKFHLQTNIVVLIFGILIGIFSISASYGADSAITREEMAVTASRIVVGEVTAIESYWNADRSNIYTLITLKVEADLKNQQTPGQIQIRVPGGIVGDIGQVVVGMPEFALNERVIVFLNDGLDSVIGQAQGKFSVAKDVVVGTNLKMIDFIDEIRGYVKKQQPSSLGMTKGTNSLQVFPERATASIKEAKTISSYVVPKAEEPEVKSSTEFSKPAAAAAWTTIFSTGFEGAFPGSWTQAWNGTSSSPGYGYTWGDVSYSPAVGSWCAWCADDSKEGLPDLNPPGNYPNNASSWLIYGPFSVPAGVTAQVRFKYKNDSETSYDYMGWYASINNVNFSGYRHSGSTGSWVDQTFDLNNVPSLGNMAGQSQVWFAFIFTSDASNTYTGAFVDEVYIEYYSADSPPDITGISPTTQSAGTNSSVTITGANFGATQGTSTVTFAYASSTVTATPTSWSNTQIVCTVPKNANSGSVTVQTAYGSDSYSYVVSFGYSGVRWPGTFPIVNYEINENCTNVTNEGFQINAAAMEWNRVGDARFGLKIGGATTVTASSQNYHNEIFWAPITPTSIIAQTTYWYYTSTSEIIECDMTFNSQLTWGIGQSPSYFDIMNIAIHELIHFIGLSDLYGSADAEKTCYGYSSTDEVKKRSLESTDIAGIQWIYGQNTDTIPSITLSTPASDVTVNQGSSYSIQWSDSDSDDNATIAIAYDTDNNYWNGGHTWITTNQTEDADGSGDTYSWNTTSVPLGTYYLWAFIYDGTNVEVYSVSAGRITISQPIQEVTVTSPNGGENWLIGSVHNITWSSSNITNVRIEYSTNNGSSWSTITSSTPAISGSYSWTVPSTPSTQCLVRICDAADGSPCDISFYVFTIYGEQVITVTSPNGGENWLIGSVHNITWTSSYITNVRIEYSTNNGSSWSTITSSTPASSGSYSWIVLAPASTQCRVRISDTADGTPIDLSNAVFTISEAPVEQVTVTSPNGGENWLIGSVHPITWTSSNITNVRIEYSTNNGSSWSTITVSTPASAGSYSWTVPSTPSTQCLVRVCDAADGSPCDQSDGIIILYEAPVEQVTVTSPNGGENWLIGTSHNITWSYSSITNVRIEYSTNNGSSWSTIIASTAASAGSYPWTVPNTPSAQCIVRISDAADGSPVDQSNAVFTISTIPSGLTHFTNVVAATGRTQPVYVTEALLNGVSLVANDEIGVFDGTLLVGAAVVTTFPMANPITVYLEYVPPSGPTLPGGHDGNQLIFKVWQRSSNVEQKAKIKEVVSGANPPVFQEGAIVAVKLEAPELEHFTNVVAATGRTQPVYVTEALLNGVSLVANDEIGVFDGTLLVGAAVVTTFPMANPITVYLEYVPPSGPTLIGAHDGNLLIFKVWQRSSNSEYSARISEVVNGANPPVFQEGAIVAVKLQAPGTMTQNITIAASKLNLISLNVTPESLSAATVFGSIPNLVSATDDNGKVYIPPNVVFFGHPGSNTIGNVDLAKAYSIFISGTTSQVLSVVGTVINPSSLPIPVQASKLNKVSYPLQSPIAITSVFSSTVNSNVYNQLVTVQDDNGLVFIPPNIVFAGHPGSNTIGNMQPGKGYNLYHKSTSALSYTYPGTGSALEPVRQQQAVEPATHFVYGVTGEAHALFIREVPVELQVGDELGVYAGALCVGGARYTGVSSDPVIIWRAVPEYGLAGIVDGDRIKMKYYSRSNGLEEELMVVGDVEFSAERPFSLIEIRTVKTTEVEEKMSMPMEMTLYQNYPNPFNPTTTIRYALSKSGPVELTIFDIQGKLVRTLVGGRLNAGEQEVRWDGMNDSGIQVPAGLYFVRLRADRFEAIKKLSFLK